MSTLLFSKKNLHNKKLSSKIFFASVVLYLFSNLLVDKCYAELTAESTLTEVTNALASKNSNETFKQALANEELLQKLTDAAKKQFSNGNQEATDEQMSTLSREKCKDRDCEIRFAMALDAVGKDLSIQGDLHGDANSFVRMIKEIGIDNDFTLKKKGLLKKKEILFIVTGDIIDRGKQSEAVIYLISRLKIANPRNFFVLRGNHEFHTPDNPMAKGIRAHFPKKSSVQNILPFMFPSALFIKIRKNPHSQGQYILVGHGILDSDLNPTMLLQNADLPATTSLKCLEAHDSPIKSKAFFETGDFVADDSDNLFVISTKRGGELKCINLCKIEALKQLPGYELVAGIIGGHQHIYDETFPVNVLSVVKDTKNYYEFGGFKNKAGDTIMEPSKHQAYMVIATPQTKKFELEFEHPVKLYSSPGGLQMTHEGFIKVNLNKSNKIIITPFIFEIPKEERDEIEGKKKARRQEGY